MYDRKTDDRCRGCLRALTYRLAAGGGASCMSAHDARDSNSRLHRFCDERGDGRDFLRVHVADPFVRCFFMIGTNERLTDRYKRPVWITCVDCFDAPSNGRTL